MTYKRKEVIGGRAVTFIADQRTVTVYAIKESDGVSTVYVGSTLQQLRDRIRGHLIDAGNGSDLPIHVWMRSKDDFVVEALERVLEVNRHDCERKWAASFDGLLNITDGGPGMSGHLFAGSEHAQKIAAKIRTGDHFGCQNCGKSFWRKQRDIKLGNNKFCSRECYQASLRGKARPIREDVRALGIAAAALARRAMSECKRGHPLSGENLYINKHGRRVCKECRKGHKRAYIQRHS